MGVLQLNLALMASLCTQYMYMYIYKCYAIYYVNAGSRKGHCQASSVPESQEPIRVRASKRAAGGKFCV